MMPIASIGLSLRFDTLAFMPAAQGTLPHAPTAHIPLLQPSYHARATTEAFCSRPAVGAADIAPWLHLAARPSVHMQLRKRGRAAQPSPSPREPSAWQEPPAFFGTVLERLLAMPDGTKHVSRAPAGRFRAAQPLRLPGARRRCAGALRGPSLRMPLYCCLAGVRQPA